MMPNYINTLSKLSKRFIHYSPRLHAPQVAQARHQTIETYENNNVLSNEQIKHFQSYGYVAVPSFWSENEILSIQTALYVLKNKGRLANVSCENDGITHCQIPKNLQLCPLSPELFIFKILPFHNKVANALNSLICTNFTHNTEGSNSNSNDLSDSAQCYLSQTFWKPKQHGIGTGWHQDNGYFHIKGYQYGTALWIPIHESTVANGTLQVGHSLKYNNLNGASLDSFDATDRNDKFTIDEYGVLPHTRDLTSDHHITCDETMVIEEKLGNVRHVELPLGGVCFFNFNIPHRTGTNDTDKERAAVAYHFVNETHFRERQFPLPEGTEYITPFVNGKKNTFGKNEYRNEIGRMEIIENEMNRLLETREYVMKMHEEMEQSRMNVNTRLVEQDRETVES